jgi:hypothetical protein
VKLMSLCRAKGILCYKQTILPTQFALQFFLR